MVVSRFGHELRTLRKRNGLSLKELGPALGVNYTYLSKIENGRSTPSEELVLRMGRYFGVDHEELLLAADRIPEDIRRILRENPREALAYLRERFTRGSRP